ncbi:hypothetical protein KKI24_01115 [bacterium]|nr:hypothetical protein [bacterium]
MNNPLCSIRLLLWFLGYWILFSVSGFAQPAGSPIVKGLFFYKSDCPECQKLQRDILPGIKQRFGEQIVILSLNTADPQGGSLLLNALVDLGIPFSQSLPIVIIGKQHWSLVSDVIEKLPDVIRDGLDASGIDWPDISGLPGFLKNLEQLPENQKQTWFISARSGALGFLFSDMGRKFNHDPLGNSYAVALLIAMIITLGYAIFLVYRNSPGEIDLLTQWFFLILSLLGIAITWQLADVDHILQSQKTFGGSFENQLALLVLASMIIGFLFSFWALYRNTSKKTVIWQRWGIPLFLIIGGIAAVYLTYIEVSHTIAVCGAVGDCNAVQQSEYTRLFGIISIGILGVFGHLFIFSIWVIGQFGPLHWRGKCKILLWCVLMIGVAFFLYLTFLEPFVIGATCFWCLTTATAMTLQLLIAASQVSRSEFPQNFKRPLFPK